MRPNNKTIVFYSIYTVLYIFPLLLVNYYYIDDMPRSLDGYGWNQDGRFLNTILMQILSFGSLSVDLFPYNNILAAMILALSGYYISKILKLEQNQQIQFSGLILLTSPMILENLSFRWDSLPMSISVISVVIPYLYKDNYKKFIPISILAIMICLLTYQPSYAIYALVAICLALSYCLNGKTLKQIFLILVIPCVCLITANILYKILIFIFQIDFSARNYSILVNRDPLQLFQYNLTKSISLISSAFNIPVSLIFLVAAIGALIAYTKFICTKNSILYKVIPILLILIVPITITFIQLILLNSSFTSRVLLGFSFFFYPLLLFINHYSERFSKYISIALLVIALPLMATYANSLKNQNIFEKYLINQITQKIGANNENIVFDGTEPWAPELQIPVNNFPILSSLVPRYFVNEVSFGRLLFYKTNYQPSKYKITIEYNELIKNKKNFPIIDKTPFYYLRANDSIAIVDFKKEED